ncbi:MAG: phosphopantetheine adenylyltransferase [Candidatus Bathyarchaeota archaeon]|nr:MAG: phosphopantetheine adenylyltransferase [Candidatus Bathyarchaeota archaeon]
MQTKYNRVGVGGTFELLHKGHKKLILKALEISDRVIIGLTTSTMLKMYPKPHKIADYEERKKQLTNFVKSREVLDKVQIVPINDPYGPALDDSTMDALVCSIETADMAKKINKLRTERGLKPLEIIVINMILAEDNVPISTTRIKNGEIGLEGKLLL